MSAFHLFLNSTPLWGYCFCYLVTQSRSSLFNSMDHSPTGSSVHGILQARTLEPVAISFSRGSSWPKDQTCLSCIGRRVIYHWATKGSLIWIYHNSFLHLLVDVHLDHFLSGAVTYMIRICVYKYSYRHVLSFVVEKLPDFPQWWYHFPFPPLMYEHSSCSTKSRQFLDQAPYLNPLFS